MIIDFHTHVYHPDYRIEPFWHGRCPLTIEKVLEAQEAGGVDISMVSNPIHELKYLDSDKQFEWVSAHNRYFAELQAKHPSVFCFATTVPWGGDRFLRE